MSRLFVPPKVAAELVEERRRREAAALDVLRSENQWEQVKHWNRELERVEPNLKLVYCPDPAPVDAVGSGAKPGRWHIVRLNPGAPISFICLETPDGGYREPGGWMFDLLREGDLWNEQVARRREELKRRAEDAKRRDEQRRREERDAEVIEAYQAATRTQVSMNRDVAWSQNASGQRAARAYRRDKRRSEE